MAGSVNAERLPTDRRAPLEEVDAYRICSFLSKRDAVVVVVVVVEADCAEGLSKINAARLQRSEPIDREKTCNNLKRVFIHDNDESLESVGPFQSGITEIAKVR